MSADRVLIAPSILACNLAKLQEEVETVESSADWLQADVMDGHFVPNLTFGAPLLKHLKTKLPLDIHLMVTNPADRLQEFFDLKDLKVQHITFHAEAIPKTAHRQAIIQRIREGGATAGIALNPETPLSAINDVVDDIDLVLIMSVRPGFSNQAFISEVLTKVRELRASHSDLMVQMDGGINPKTAAQCREAGANNLVAASAIFGASDRAQAISQLRGV